MGYSPPPRGGEYPSENWDLNSYGKLNDRYLGRSPMKWRMSLLVIAAMFLFVAVASAHHSFAAVYDGKKTVTLDGTLVQFIFRNPHSFVQVEVPDERGVIKRWSVEWSAAGQLGG